MKTLARDSFLRAAQRLATQDPALARAVERHGLPGFWHRPPGFPTLALFIVEQQVSLASAKAVFERLAASLGAVEPVQILSAPAAVLAGVGLTRQKQRYLRELAEAVDGGSLDLGGLASRPDEEARRLLLAVPGIGRWTAEVYLLSALRRPDAWPTGDRALQVGTGEILERQPPSPDELESLGDRWRPYRSVAARLIWHAYLAKRNRAETVVAGLDPIHSRHIGSG